MGKKQEPVAKITVGLVVSWVIGIFFMLCGLRSLLDTLLLGIIIIAGSLLIIPVSTKAIQNKFNFELTRGLKIVIGIILFILILVAVSKSSEPENYSSKLEELEKKLGEEQETSPPEKISEEEAPIEDTSEEEPDYIEETIKELNLADYSACDFLPDEEVIPTEYVITDPTETNNTCKQSYKEVDMLGSTIILTTRLLGTIEEAKREYDTFVEAEKSERGYSELDIAENCFAMKREGTVTRNIAYCNFAYLVYDLYMVDQGWGGHTDAFLEDVPSNIAKKTVEAWY